MCQVIWKHHHLCYPHVVQVLARTQAELLQALPVLLPPAIAEMDSATCLLAANNRRPSLHVSSKPISSIAMIHCTDLLRCCSQTPMWWANMDDS
jgi:hypothetical protein